MASRLVYEAKTRALLTPCDAMPNVAQRCHPMLPAGRDGNVLEVTYGTVDPRLPWSALRGRGDTPITFDLLIKMRPLPIYPQFNVARAPGRQGPSVPVRRCRTIKPHALIHARRDASQCRAGTASHRAQSCHLAADGGSSPLVSSVSARIPPPYGILQEQQDRVLHVLLEGLEPLCADGAVNNTVVGGE